MKPGVSRRQVRVPLSLTSDRSSNTLTSFPACRRRQLWPSLHWFPRRRERRCHVEGSYARCCQDSTLDYVGFNQLIARAKNSELPIERRYVALRAAVERFSPNGFNTTFSNLASAVEYDERDGNWTQQQLASAAELLAQSRARYQACKDHWEDERRRRKALGDTSPTLAELNALNADSWFDSISGTKKQKSRWGSLAEYVDKNGMQLAPFGQELAKDLAIVMRVMGVPKHPPAGRIIARYGPYPKLLEPSNVVSIPARIYNEPIDDSDYQQLSTRQRTILDCLYSRNHDGYVRQRHLSRIVATEELWVIPFVVAALGDYVIEIVREVVVGLAQISEPYSWQESQYRLFADHNAELVSLIRQRSISYCDRYYRKTFSLHKGNEALPRYPSLQILDAISKDSYPLPYRT